MCIITESKLSDSHAFSPLLEGYEKLISPGCSGRGGVVVLLGKDLNLQVCPVFLEPEGRLVVLDVIHNGKQSFRVATIYALMGGGRADFFKNLKRFLVKLKALVFVWRH